MSSEQESQSVSGHERVRRVGGREVFLYSQAELRMIRQAYKEAKDRGTYSKDSFWETLAGGWEKMGFPPRTAASLQVAGSRYGIVRRRERPKNTRTKSSNQAYAYWSKQDEELLIELVTSQGRKEGIKSFLKEQPHRTANSAKTKLYRMSEGGQVTVGRTRKRPAKPWVEVRPKVEGTSETQEAILAILASDMSEKDKLTAIRVLASKA